VMLILPIPQPNARAVAVLIDENDAGGFESTTNRCNVVRGASDGSHASFHAPQGWSGDICVVS